MASQPSRVSVAVRLLLSVALALLTLPLLSPPASADHAAAPTSVAIDGNQDGLPDDWQGYDLGDAGFAVIRDGVGNADGTGITGQERDHDGENPEKPWAATKATASGKSDVGNVLVSSFRQGGPTGDLWAAVGFDRGNGSGTQRYYLELNQAEHDSLMPTRSQGDLRVVLAVNGNGLEECQGAQLWTGSQWGQVKPCAGVIGFDVNDAPVADYFGSPYAVSGQIPTNQFFEVGINLTDLGATSCPVAGFRTFDMRTQEGAENGDTGQLKDVIRGPVDIASDCATLKIVKADAATGAPVTVPGAKFSIDPNPTPGAADQASKTVVDNNTGPADLTDSDPAPGRITVTNVRPSVGYTVTEIEAPAGYLLPATCATDAEDADRCTKKTLGQGETVTFTFADKRRYDAPTVTKNAVATYDARYTWDIDKAVRNPGGSYGSAATENVPQGTPATFDYLVTVTEGERTRSGWEVHGTVTVKNTNKLPMTVTLSDRLSDGTPCTFPSVTDVSGETGLQVSLPADAETGYAYVCAPGDGAADGVNKAEVEWSLAAYPQTEQQAWAADPGTGKAEGTKAFSYVVDQETDKTVTVTDNQHTFDPAWVNTWGTGSNPETRGYQKTFPGVAGTCTDYDNTATITETGQSDSAQATVCVGKDLVVTKNKVADLTRTYAFDIEKSATDTTLEVDAETGTARADYKVTVTDGPATDSQWVMRGSIFVSNPNDWQSVELTGVEDAYNGDAGSCVVDTSGGMTIGRGQQDKRFDYTCTFDEKPAYDGTNVATVSWDKAAAATPSGTASGSAAVVEADWDVTEVGRTVHVVDDKTVPGAVHQLGAVTWQEQGTTHEFTYSLQLAGLPGQCVDHRNVATITETRRTAVETVTVCAPLGVSVEKTAAGTYDRTYHWKIAKAVDRTKVSIDGGSHTFGYTVTATPDGYTDGGWTMGGLITVKNPNTFRTMTVDITDVPNVGGGAVCTVTDGTGVVLDKATLVDGEVVPATKTRPYECTFTSSPTYAGGTNTAVAQWDGGSASSVPTTVPFTLDHETDKVVHVVDDKTQPGQSFPLGTADWSDDPTEFAYSLTKQGVLGRCTTYDNTATIAETEQSASAAATLCVQAPLEVSKTVEATYDRTYLWTITKAADKTEVELVDGDTAMFGYTVTVTPDGSVDSGWTMAGVISVHNPNSVAVGSITADVTDLTDVGGTCTVEGGDAVEIAAGATVKLPYDCSFDTDGPDGYEGTNTATAVWAGNDGTRTATGSAEVGFVLDDEVNDTVDVYDTLDDATVPGTGEPELLGTADWFAGKKELTYSRELGGVAGSCVDHDNTAVIAQTRQSADATVTVCAEAALELDKTVAATYERTYHWKLDKVAAQLDDVEVTSGDTATFDYTVAATPLGFTDHSFAMSGTVTVTNPNTYAAGSIEATVTDVPDLGPGVSCEVRDGVDVVLAPGETRTLDYTCRISGTPEHQGSNQAVATWTGPGDEARNATSDSDPVTDGQQPEPVTFALVEEIDETVTVVDDKTKPGEEVVLGTATWNAGGTPTTFTYQLPLTGQRGRCADFVNTATVPLDGNPDLSDNATVTLCVEDDAVLANVVAASFDRSYAWSVGKASDGTSFQAGDAGTARVDYTVTATPGAATDSGWAMRGSLTVTNPNDYKSLSVGVSTATTLGAGTSCALDPGQDLTVPAGSSRTYGYSCAFTSQPAYSGTDSTRVTWNGGSVTIDTPVSFALDQATNRTVDVVDDQTVPGRVVPLGTATWNESGAASTFGYTLELAADVNECESYTNTASIVQTGQQGAATVQVCGPQILPAEEVLPQQPRPQQQSPERPRPPVVIRSEQALPNTGGPHTVFLWSGIGLLLAGGGLLLTRRRRLGA